MKKIIAIFCLAITVSLFITSCAIPTAQQKRQHAPGQIPTGLQCDPRAAKCT